MISVEEKKPTTKLTKKAMFIDRCQWLGRTRKKHPMITLFLLYIQLQVSLAPCPIEGGEIRLPL